MKLILVVESSCNQPAIISSTTAATTTEIIMTSIPTASEFIIYRILLIIRLSLVNRYLLKYLHEGCCSYIILTSARGRRDYKPQHPEWEVLNVFIYSF